MKKFLIALATTVVLVGPAHAEWSFDQRKPAKVWEDFPQGEICLFRKDESEDLMGYPQGSVPCA